MEQDAAKAAPNLYKVLLDNDRVRVLEFKGGPGTRAPMHSHPDVVAYLISGGTMAMTLPDGSSPEMDLKAGEVIFVEAMSHSVEIKGSTELHGILVELKK